MAKAEKYSEPQGFTDPCMCPLTSGHPRGSKQIRPGKILGGQSAAQNNAALMAAHDKRVPVTSHGLPHHLRF